MDTTLAYVAHGQTCERKFLFDYKIVYIIVNIRDVHAAWEADSQPSIAKGEATGQKQKEPPASGVVRSAGRGASGNEAGISFRFRVIGLEAARSIKDWDCGRDRILRWGQQTGWCSKQNGNVQENKRVAKMSSAYQGFTAARATPTPPYRRGRAPTGARWSDKAQDPNRSESEDESHHPEVPGTSIEVWRVAILVPDGKW